MNNPCRLQSYKQWIVKKNVLTQETIVFIGVGQFKLWSLSLNSFLLFSQA